MKRKLPLYLMFIIAIWGFISIFMGKSQIHDFDTLLRNKLLLVVGAFAIILGLGSLIIYHMQKIKHKAQYWQYSYIMLIALVLSSIIGLFGGVHGEGALPTIFGGTILHGYQKHVYAFLNKEELETFLTNPGKYADPEKSIIALPETMDENLSRYDAAVLRRSIRMENKKRKMLGEKIAPMISPVSGKEVPFIRAFSINIQSLYEGILVPCASTMFAMLAFYMCSAAFRAFRMRNLHAGVLLISAFIVMLGQIPLATAFIPGLHELRQWILDVPNMASKRGIMIGVGLGAAATSFKIIFGIERAWLGGGDE